MMARSCYSFAEPGRFFFLTCTVVAQDLFAHADPGQGIHAVKPAFLLSVNFTLPYCHAPPISLSLCFYEVKHFRHETCLYVIRNG